MNELAILLDPESKEFIYEQIYRYIKEKIMTGKLLQGEKLPSTRFLAEHLQVSRNTVDLAYDQLVSEGYIEAKPYRGYYVCAVDDLFHMDVTPQLPLVQKSEREEIYQYNLSPHGIDMTHFPFATWRKLVKDVLAMDAADLFQMGDSKGDLLFRSTICNYLQSSRGVECHPEQIVVGAGNDYLFLLLEKILGKNKVMAMENPTYTRAYEAFSLAGYQMVSIPLDENGMQINELVKAEADVAYIMPSHQFPTGVVMPIGRRMELLKWATGKESRYLIEDDYDSEFRYKGKPIPALQASDKKDKVIYMGTFSKSIAPAIRISYMVLPLTLLAVYEDRCKFLSCSVSRIDQAILNIFLQNGHYERYLNKMRKVYKGKHDMLLEALKPLRKKFRIKGENAGLHILIETKENVAEDILIEKAEKEKIKVYGMSHYLFEKKEHTEYKATILIGYANLTEEEIKEAVAKLIKAWL